MLLRFSLPRFFTIPLLRTIDFFDFLLFLFFMTLHADQLHLVFGSYTLRANTLLALFLFVALLMHSQGKILSMHRGLLYATTAIFCSIILSFFFTPYKSRCFFFMGWWGLNTLCYLVLPYVVMQKGDYRKIFGFYVASFFVVGCFACMQLLMSFFGMTVPFAEQVIKETFVRPNAFAYEPSYYALYMTPFVVIMHLYYLLQRETSYFLFPRLTKKTLLFVHFLFLISTATTTLFAYLLFLLTLGVIRLGTQWKNEIPFLGKRLLRASLFVGIGIALLSITFPHLAKQYYLKFFIGDFRTHHSFVERWSGIVNAWNIFMEHPWVGVGLGGIPSHLFEAWARGDKSYLFLVQNALIGDTVRFLKLFEPTNVFTEILASLGIVGLLAFGWLMGTYMKLVKQARKTLENSHEKTGVFILFISVIVSLTVLQFNQGVFRPYIWTHFALAFAFTEKLLLNHSMVSRSPSSSGVC